MAQPSLTSTNAETELARRIRMMSAERWGNHRETVLIGQHASIMGLQERAQSFAQAGGPVLITGETGTGKEIIARAIYLLSARNKKPFFSVNCAQFTESQLVASELFGHKRGSFTGAFEDHRGVFSEADGGVVFLDEVGELTLPTQAMLLRVLSEGELVPVGDTRVRNVNVRVIAATNRDLRALVAQGRFREDLLFRLRYMQLHVPPLRVRGSDWRLMLDYYLHRLNARTNSKKNFSDQALERLSGYTWPGNVRELCSVVETSHSLCSGTGPIEPRVFEDQLECTGVPDACISAIGTAPTESSTPHRVADCIARLTSREGTFWQVVYGPFMDRELNRQEVRAIVNEALQRSNWSYKRALPLFGVLPEEYLKFMAFLRHHRLKPER